MAVAAQGLMRPEAAAAVASPAAIGGALGALGMKPAAVAVWAGPLSAAMLERGITTPRRASAALATWWHESAGFNRLAENLNYSPQGLAETWPTRFARRGTPRQPNARAMQLGRTQAHPADQPGIAEAAYGGRMGNTAPGDGWRHRGRGITQLTGGDMYREAGVALGLPLAEQPELAAEPAVAARVAAWVWARKGCNPLADVGDVEGWRRAINGGLVGLAKVRGLYDRLRARWA